MPTVPTVREAKRQATVDVLILAAQRGLTSHGLDLTIDDVADIAGVNRSTIFRHFASRDDLFAAAVIKGGSEFDRSLPEYDGGDWRVWLRQLCDVSHRRAEETSRGLWELTRRRDLSPALTDALSRLQEGRRLRYLSIASTLWRAADRDDPVPATICDVVAAHLSPLFTITVLTDIAGSDSQLAATLAESCIAAVLNQGRGDHKHPST